MKIGERITCSNGKTYEKREEISTFGAGCDGCCFFYPFPRRCNEKPRELKGKCHEGYILGIFVEVSPVSDWKPKNGDTVWYISDTGRIDNFIVYLSCDYPYVSFANYFRTRQLARIAKKEMANLLKNLKHG